MLRVFNCIATEHDFGLLAIAAVICAAGSWLSVRLLAKARTRSDSLLALSFTASIAAGAAIWTTHFIAMVAYAPGVGHAYEPKLTVLSLGMAIVTCWIGFTLALKRSIRIGPEIGGAVVGLGVTAMHFTGMSAFLIAGHIQWDPVLVTAAVVFGMSFGALALNRALRPGLHNQQIGAAILTLAVVSMHFTAMGAVSIIPDPTIAVPLKSVSSEMLALAAAGMAVLVLCTNFVSQINDSRMSNELRLQMHLLAHTDALTGLPNRAAFQAELNSLLGAAQAKGGRFTVLVFDLNRFKEVNDVHGHGAGDEVLSELAQRLQRLREKKEFIARVGGDEFVLLRRDVSEGEDVAAIVTRIRTAFEVAFIYHGNELQIGASFGGAVYPEDGASSDTLLNNADVAMYRAKKTGELIAFSRFDKAMDDVIHEKRALVLELGSALEKNQFEMHYQLQQAIPSGTVSGFEALIRWRHPERGLISPAKFIPLAEESGLIIPLGEWALETACREAMSWTEPLKVAVNLSPVQFKQSDLPGTVLRILMQTGLNPARLELEITESTLIEDFDRVLSILRRLKALGVSIAMDDFGTGYSSLSTLQTFPFDKIKIDKSFIDNITTRHQAAAIVRSVLMLGRDLDIPVLAEGVETKDHLDFLRGAGCDEVQGYFLGRPQPSNAIRHLVGLTPDAEAVKVAS